MRIGTTFYQNNQQHTGATDGQLRTSFAELKSDGIYAIIIPIFPNVYNSTVRDRVKWITQLAGEARLKVIINCHTWYTGSNVPSTWVNQRNTFTDSSKKAMWIDFIKRFVQELDGVYVWKFQLCNELGLNKWTNPNSINYDGAITKDLFYQWMLDTYNAARSVTNKPLEARYAMMQFGTSYMEDRVIKIWDGICLNYYHGIDSASNEATLKSYVDRCKALGKEVSITEYGKNSTSDSVQNSTYVTSLDIFSRCGIVNAFNWWMSPANGVGELGYNCWLNGQPRQAYNTMISYVTVPVKYTLTVSIAGNGITSPLPGTYTYDKDTKVPLTYTPSNSYKFSYWELDGVNIGSPVEISMGSDHNLNAVFTLIPETPEQTIARLKAELSDSNNKLAYASSQLTAANARIQELESQNQVLFNKVADIQSQLDESKSVIASLTEEISQLTLDKTALQIKLIDISKQIQDIVNHLNEIRNSI